MIFGRKILLGLVLGGAVSCAYAQTPSPADVGIVHGNPDVFKLLDSSKTWTPFGSVNPTTHIFTPVGGSGGGGGTINVPPAGTTPINGGCPNGQFLYNNAGNVACVAVSGGGGSTAITFYPTHALLTAGVTTPTGPTTVVQQGFYAAGDGGGATYLWNASSYCPSGTSGAPVAADGIVCILPVGQSPSTAGRYLLANSGSIDVRQVGMQPGGQDNSPYVQALMNAQNTFTSTQPGSEIIFPSILGQIVANYYFSQPFVVSKGSTIKCQGSTNSFVGPVYLVFAPGIDGVVQETGFFSPDASYGSGSIDGCSIISLGGGATASTVAVGVGGNSLTNVALNGNVSTDFTMPASCNPLGHSCTIGVGDGLVVFSEHKPINSAPQVAPGAYVATSNPGAGTLTLASPYVFLPNVTPSSVMLWDLPAAQKYLVVTTAGSNTFTVLSGPRILHVGDMLWSDAFVFGTTVWSIQNNMVGTPTVHTGGSGYVGASGTMTWSGPGCVGAWNDPPVLNVTASGGVIDAVSSVSDPGECLQGTPSSSATTWTPGGGLSGGSGASFNMVWNQIVQTDTAPLGASAPALVTHTSGSPGQLWTIPGGIVRRTESQSHGDNVSYFGLDMNMTCSSGSGPSTGCNSSFDEHNTFTNALVGRLVRGDNTAASTVIGNIFAENSVADEIEAGSLGSTYISEEYNSEEDATSIYDFLGFCGSQNYSVMMGQYSTGGGNSAYCLGVDTQGNTNIGTATDPAQGSMLFINGVYNSPFPSIGPLALLSGNWQFRGPTDTTISATAATASGNVVALNTPTIISAGLGVTDLTNAVIPGGTTVTQSSPAQITLSNALTGGGVQIGDQLKFSHVSGTMCFIAAPGLVTTSFAGMGWSAGCDSAVVGMSYSGFLNAWTLGISASEIVLADASYLGYAPGGPGHLVFPSGFTMGSNDGGFAGRERFFDIGQSFPSQPWRLWGDTRFFDEATPGSFAMMSNTQLSTVSLTASIAVGATSVAVTGCPTLPAGTPIIAEHNRTVPGAVDLDQPLGTLAACVGTTLTLQAGATNAVASGAAIQFLSWRPAAPVANDLAGTSWTLGNYLTLTPVAFASLPTTCTAGTFAVISDGAASPVYNASASSAGAATDPVFCSNGNVWKYH